MVEDFKIKCLDPVIYAYDNDMNPTIMYSCGKCSLCRDRVRRQWASRMECEASISKSVFFVTLTYSDEHLPLVETTDIMTLRKLHYKNFLKSFRKALPFKIRMFGVGEYGKESRRPHYHFIIFCPEWINRNVFRQYVSNSWKYGFNTVKNANVQRFYYIAKYCTKETSAPLGAERGFQSSSQNPPIGYQHFIANNDIYRNIDVNYMVSPSFRKSSLPRSFEARIKRDLSNIPRTTMDDPSNLRSIRLRKRAGLLLKQYVVDFNNLTASEFVRRRDAIERRLNKKTYKLNQI